MPTNLLNANYLIASMLWGALGSGFFLYGWKQKATLPIAGGILLSGGTYFIESALYLSLFSLIVLGGMYWAKKTGVLDS